jgi:hypothetical protein
MYYRLEAELDYYLIKHVETDREVGHVYFYDAVQADGSISQGCRLYNSALECIPTSIIPITRAAMIAAVHQEHYGFPDLKGAEWNVHSDRVERRLGTLLADTAWAFARAFCEASDQGLTAETTDKFATSLAGLGSIWLASRGGSYNATDCTDEPYFANPLPSGPRLTFSGAAQAYGMRELRERYPNLSDADRYKLLRWVLQWLSDLLWNERKEQEKERERALARMLDAQRRYASTKVPKARRCHS